MIVFFFWVYKEEFEFVIYGSWGSNLRVVNFVLYDVIDICVW